LIIVAGVLIKKFPSYTDAIDLVCSMKLTPNFGNSTGPNDDVETFINTIESAYPSTDEYGEDDLGIMWGHKQLGGWKDHITSWQAVGTTETALRLIASILKTYEVARQLVPDGGGRFISECFLQEITEHLWILWKEAGGVRQLLCFMTTLT